ncbi:MAG: SDR family NAD(P)-dependent oxidoreductase [Patescibacteria group bacterium]
MKVLITGVAGFIGSNLAEYLLNNDYEVVGIDNFNEFYKRKIKDYNIKDFVNNPNFKLYEIDITDEASLENTFKEESGFDAVVHLAAWAGVTLSIEKAVVYVKNNVEGTVKLLDTMVKYDTKNIIFASTSSVYGNNPTPFKENMITDHPFAPYPATKKACEIMLSTYSRNFGVNVSVFRIFNPLGPRVRPDLAMPKLIRSCLYGTEFPQYQDSEKTGRDYTYVKHLFEAMEYVFQHPFTYEIFNVGNSSPVTLGELVNTVEKVVGKKANIKAMPQRQGEMVQTYADISKAKSMLNYNPSTTIEESVSIYYEWFIAQEDWYKKGEF